MSELVLNYEGAYMGTDDQVTANWDPGDRLELPEPLFVGNVDFRYDPPTENGLPLPPTMAAVLDGGTGAWETSDPDYEDDSPLIAPRTIL